MKSPGGNLPRHRAKGNGSGGCWGRGKEAAGKTRGMKSAKSDCGVCFLYGVSFNPPRML